MLKLFILTILLNFHPVHVTLTTITQAQDSDSLKVFFRMYYDDFLRDYKLYDPNSNLKILSADQSFPADLVSKYFNDKVQIHINNKLLTGKVLNLSIQDNEIFLNLVYRSDKNPQRIKIRNQVLIGLYSDQTNMIFIRINKNEEAMRLTSKHFKEILSF